MQRYTLKFNFQIKFYFFIENLCFCSLKIAVCAPKITAESKNYRLKITIISKNYRLKIPVRVRVYARIWLQANSHRNTGPPDTPTEHKTTGKAEKPAYIGKFAGNEKKVQKKLKKICK